MKHPTWKYKCSRCGERKPSKDVITLSYKIICFACLRLALGLLDKEDDDE